jgi:HlyD family secretion protein
MPPPANVVLAAFPMGAPGLRALLRNGDRADTPCHQGSPYVARIRLTELTAGGHAWTTARGEEVALSSGALAGLEILSSLHRPIDLVSPAVRKFLGR